MTEYDMQLARGVDDGYTNLAIGEPYVIQDALRIWRMFPTAQAKFQMYPPAAGDPALLEALQERYPGKHIVVANGAKQALLAAINAIDPVERCHALNTRAPYWPSFPTLAGLSSLYFSTDNADGNVVNLITYPNNPDGVVEQPKRRYDIWDAAYAHPVYGYSRENEPDWKIKVESASKMFGMSGFRLGWLVTDDEELAKDAAHYVEVHTSGVCVPAQRYLVNVLRADDRGDFDKGYMEARAALLENGLLFNAHLGNFVDEVHGVPANNTGMFAWFHVHEDHQLTFKAALQSCKIRLVSGEACGGGPGWYRMSMGHLPSVTREALERLIREMLNA